MKTSIKLITLAALLASAVCFTGCQTAVKKIADVNATLIALDQLGLTQVDIPGRATSTHYTRVEKDGQIISTLTHNNPGLSEPIKVVRVRPAAAAK